MKLKKDFLDKFLLLQIFLLFILIFISYKAIEKNKPVRKELSILKNQVENIKKENKEFENKIEYFNLEANLEKEIKKSLNLGYNGERFIVFPEIKEEKEKKKSFLEDLIIKFIK